MLAGVSITDLSFKKRVPGRKTRVDAGLQLEGGFSCSCATVAQIRVRVKQERRGEI